MKCFTVVLFILIFMLMPALGSGQNYNLKTTALVMHITKPSLHLSTFNNNNFTVLSGYVEPTIFKPQYSLYLQEIKPVPFEAFFCKMEVKAANKLGVWIKVHAGDYDVYNKNSR